MRDENATPAGKAGVGVRQEKLGERDRSALTAHAQAGKSLALFLYNVGARTLRATQDAFARHPEWASA